MDKDINYLLTFTRITSFGKDETFKKFVIDNRYWFETQIGNNPYQINNRFLRDVWKKKIEPADRPLYMDIINEVLSNKILGKHQRNEQPLKSENKKIKIQKGLRVKSKLREGANFRSGTIVDQPILEDGQNITILYDEGINKTDKQIDNPNNGYLEDIALDQFNQIEEIGNDEYYEYGQNKKNEKHVEKLIKLANERYNEYQKYLQKKEEIEKEEIEKEKAYKQEKINKKYDEVTIDNSNPDIHIILYLFMIMDMYKDFIINFEIIKDIERKEQSQLLRTPTTQKKYPKLEHQKQQQQILFDALSVFLEKEKEFFNKNEELKTAISNFISKKKLVFLELIHTKLDQLLGIQIYFPMQLMNTLFPDLLNKKAMLTSFMQFLKYATNNNSEDEFERLKEISNKYIEHKTLDFKTRENNEENIIKKLNKPQSETMAWVEASNGLKKIPETSGILDKLAQYKKLSSIKNPGMELDSAGVENELIERINSLELNYKDYKMENIVKILVKTPNNKQLINLLLEKKKKSYELIINEFFGLKCSKFKGLENAQEINYKISRGSVWNTLIRLFEGKFLYSGYSQKHPNFNELDLCIKSNKTAMDMLKSIFAKMYSDQHPNQDIISIYNDYNAAKFMCAISKKGFIVFSSSIKAKPLLDLTTEERIFLRKEYADILLSPFVQKELTQEASQGLEEQIEEIGETSSQESYKTAQEYNDEPLVPRKLFDNIILEEDESESITLNGMRFSRIGVRSDGNCLYDSLAKTAQGIDPSINVHDYSKEIQNILRIILNEIYKFFKNGGSKNDFFIILDEFGINLDNYGEWLHYYFSFLNDNDWNNIKNFIDGNDIWGTDAMIQVFSAVINTRIIVYSQNLGNYSLDTANQLNNKLQNQELIYLYNFDGLHYEPLILNDQMEFGKSIDSEIKYLKSFF